jgi:hypothetical protein
MLFLSSLGFDPGWLLYENVSSMALTNIQLEFICVYRRGESVIDFT